VIVVIPDDSGTEKLNPDQQARRETWFRVIMAGAFFGVTLAYMGAALFEQPTRADNFTNGFSTSPAGHSALIELLRENGREVEAGHSKLRLPEWDGRDTDTLALLQPGPEYIDRFHGEFRELFATAREAECSLLLVLPKRVYEEADEQPEDGDIVLWEDVHPLEAVQGVLASAGFGDALSVQRIERAGLSLEWSGSSRTTTMAGPVQVFRTARGRLGSEFETLATVDGAPVILRYSTRSGVQTGGVFLVSDPDIFTNRYIDQPGAASIVIELFSKTPQGGAVLVDEDLHGFSTDASLEYLATTPPGLWVTLSVVLLLGVFGWRQATVLRPLSAEAQDRRARKFSIEGLARMMERAGDHDKAYRRIMRRSRLVLGTGGAQVQGAGKQGTHAIKKGKTGRITRIEGVTTEERLINAARRVAHQKRTGEAAGDDWQ